MPDRKQRGLKGAREDQLAVAEFDHLSERRDQRGKVQGDHVPAGATPHTPRTSTVARTPPAPLNVFYTG